MLVNLLRKIIKKIKNVLTVAKCYGKVLLLGKSPERRVSTLTLAF